MELSPEVEHKHRVAMLAGAVVTSFQLHQPGLEEFGTGGLYELEALQANLLADGIGFDEDDLAEALQLLEEGCTGSGLPDRMAHRVSEGVPAGSTGDGAHTSQAVLINRTPGCNSPLSRPARVRPAGGARTLGASGKAQSSCAVATI
jgi:hypothetical protein